MAKLRKRDFGSFKKSCKLIFTIFGVKYTKMVIEVKDSFIRSLKNGIPPIRAITGERSWSPLLEKREIADWSGIVRVENFSAGEDTLQYSVDNFLVRKQKWLYGLGQSAKTEEIKDPEKPWSGRVRWR